MKAMSLDEGTPITGQARCRGRQRFVKAAPQMLLIRGGEATRRRQDSTLPYDSASAGTLKTVNMPRLFIEGPTGIANVVQLQIPRTTVGRALLNTIVLDDLRVSRLHAVIDLEVSLFIVKDLWSKNGVYLNGRKVHAKALSSGDTLNVGDCSIRFIAERDYEEAVAEPLASIPGFQIHRTADWAPG